VDVVIDVRSRLEFWLRHLEGAICVPVDVLPDRVGTTPTLTADAHVMVYCASGARSAMAAGQLRALGFRRVTDAGGFAEAARHYVAGA
jgi:rhodanese-related sulfurtransferase